MKKHKANTLIGRYVSNKGYAKHQEPGHEMPHVLSGFPGGPDFGVMDPAQLFNAWHAPVSLLGNNVDPEVAAAQKKLMHFLSFNLHQRLFQPDQTQHSRFLYSLSGKRNESVIGFMEDNKLQAEAAYFTKSASSEYDRYADVPFYQDEVAIQQHIAYLNTRMLMPLEVFQHEDFDGEVDIHLPKTVAEYEDMIQSATAYGRSKDLEIVSGNYRVFYSIGSDEVLEGSHIAYSQDKHHVVSNRPILYEKPHPHLLYGEKMKIILAKLPEETDNLDKLPNFLQCMTELSQNLLQDVYVRNTPKHLERWKENKSLLIDSPYKGKMYQAYIGPYQVVTLPDSCVVDSFDIGAEDITKIDENNIADLAGRIKKRFALDQ